MKRIKKITALLLAACLVLGLFACGEQEEEEPGAEYHMYFLSLSETSLETEDYIPKERTTQAMVDEIAKLLGEEPKSEEHLPLIPENVLMKSYTYTGQIVTVNFDEEYKKMKNTRELLVRAGIVKAFTQIPGVTYVQFEENGEPMTDSEGETIGLMDKNTFVENEGQNINSYTFANLNLYFSNKTGDRLLKETRQVPYSSNIPLEKVVVEKLLEGPKDSGLYPTLSPNTKILGVSIVEGICYVNLDKSFLSESMNVQEKLPIYSIVNSLTDACNIHGVQISVEGETKVTFRESMKLDQLYQADYGLVGEEADD